MSLKLGDAPGRSTQASSSRPGSLLPSDLRMAVSSPELNLLNLSGTKNVQISSSVLISCNQSLSFYSHKIESRFKESVPRSSE